MLRWDESRHTWLQVHRAIRMNSKYLGLLHLWPPSPRFGIAHFKPSRCFCLISDATCNFLLQIIKTRVNPASSSSSARLAALQRSHNRPNRQHDGKVTYQWKNWSCLRIEKLQKKRHKHKSYLQAFNKLLFLESWSFFWVYSKHSAKEDIDMHRSAIFGFTLLWLTR